MSSGRALGHAGGEHALALLRLGVRRWGLLTASSRPLPDFLVIGAKRGGTTSLYFDLIEHPAILAMFPAPLPGLKPHATKGVHYFDVHATRSERWYRSYMPTRRHRERIARRVGGPVVVGEASPYYLFHPDAARRAHACVPGARLVVLLREPALRAHSHWKERRRTGVEPLDFAAALAAEPERLAGERARLLEDPAYTSYAWEQQSYLAQSRYAELLRPWVERFGPEQVLVLASEDYYADPVSTLGEVDEFLGLPRRTVSSARVRNAAPGADLDPETRRRINAKLAPDVTALSEITGRTFPWPR